MSNSDVKPRVYATVIVVQEIEIECSQELASEILAEGDARSRVEKWVKEHQHDLRDYQESSEIKHLSIGEIEFLHPDQTDEWDWDEE